jgi:hypothetical protein
MRSTVVVTLKSSKSKMCQIPTPPPEPTVVLCPDRDPVPPHGRESILRPRRFFWCLRVFVLKSRLPEERPSDPVARKNSGRRRCNGFTTAA